MSLKENMEVKRERYWASEGKRIRKIIPKMLLNYQENELFSSDIYKIKIHAKLIKDEYEVYSLRIYATVVDKDESNLKSVFITHCVRDYAIQKYVGLFNSIFEENEITVTNSDSCVSIKDMENGDEKVIIEGIIEVD